MNLLPTDPNKITAKDRPHFAANRGTKGTHMPVKKWRTHNSRHGDRIKLATDSAAAIVSTLLEDGLDK